MPFRRSAQRGVRRRRIYIYTFSGALLRKFEIKLCLAAAKEEITKLRLYAVMYLLYSMYVLVLVLVQRHIFRQF